MGSNVVRFDSEPTFEISSSFAAYITTFCQNSEILIFWSSIVILKFQMARAVNFFFEIEIFDVRFGISLPKDIKMGDVAIALPEKMVITTRTIIMGR